MKKVGIVGCGDISGIYIKNIAEMFADKLQVAGVYDLNPKRSAITAKKYGIPRSYEFLNDLVNDPSVEIVLNLTPPAAHYEISRQALLAGKHVYTEKPLGCDLEEGLKLIELSHAAGLKIGGAPDTFLGAGLQTCRRLIDDGAIGEVFGASAFVASRGVEKWHPNPQIFFSRGGGPMLDLGPYYITALVSLLGAVMGVTGITRQTAIERAVESKPKRGEIINPDVPTHVTGMLEFEAGVSATITTSYDIYASKTAPIEIYGTEGTLSVPDPNTFGGPIYLFSPDTDKFTEVPLEGKYSTNSRGAGLYDMVLHIEDNTPFRASDALILHTLEVMTGFMRSHKRKGFEWMETAPKRPAPLSR